MTPPLTDSNPIIVQHSSTHRTISLQECLDGQALRITITLRRVQSCGRAYLHAPPRYVRCQKDAVCNSGPPLRHAPVEMPTFKIGVWPQAELEVIVAEDDAEFDRLSNNIGAPCVR